MAGSVNKVILVGNLGKGPEIRTLNSGERVVNLSLATSESWRDKATGEKKEKTEWHRIVAFNDNIVKVAENYLRKGSTIYVEGSLQTRKYEQNGVEKYATEIHLGKFNGVLTMLGGKSEGGSDDSFSGRRDEAVARGGGGGDHQDGQRTGTRTAAYDLDDGIPFVRQALSGEA